MDNIAQVVRNNRMRLLATKREQLESAVTVGEYWRIQCEINTIVELLNQQDNDDKN